MEEKVDIFRNRKVSINGVLAGIFLFPALLFMIIFLKPGKNIQFMSTHYYDAPAFLFYADKLLLFC